MKEAKMNSCEISKEIKKIDIAGSLSDWTHEQRLNYLDSFRKVECLYRLTCVEADLTKKKHCPGRLFDARRQSSNGVVSIKCEKTKKVLMFRLENEASTHIAEHSEEFQQLENCLEPLNCPSCGQRVFDTIPGQSQIEILIKCPRDKNAMVLMVNPEKTIALDL